MKPEGWDEMDPVTKKTYAETLLNTLRGHYILAQALALGIKALNRVPAEFRENSNLQDMEMLREMIFTFPLPEDMPTRPEPVLAKG